MTNYYFVDESGDPNFYDRNGKLIAGLEGCSPILLLSFCKTKQPHKLRKQILQLQSEVLGKPYFSGVPSIEKRRANFYFHAKDDIPEVRVKFFELIEQMDIAVHIVMARKIEAIFTDIHNANPNTFYNSVVTSLFKNQLSSEEKNIIFFEKRGTKSKQNALERSIYDALPIWETFENTVIVQNPTHEPCLQIIDYINRAMQRALLRGETRFLLSLQQHIKLVRDIYDTDNYPNNIYQPVDNFFDIKKVPPIKAR